MNRTAFLLLSLSASALLSIGAGCGNSSVTTTTGAGGTTGTGGTSASSTSASSTTGTGGSTEKLDCASYCTEILANCTAANAQYTGMDTCMGECKSLPPGALTDTSGDTLGCRIYHAGAPAKMDPVMHCPHAGPTGGSPDPTKMSACGDPCEAFCNLEATACTGANQVYATTAACVTACKLFPAAVPPAAAATFSTADTSGNTYDCRMYHLTAATTAPTTHCPHTAAVSSVCM